MVILYYSSIKFLIMPITEHPENLPRTPRAAATSENEVTLSFKSLLSWLLFTKFWALLSLLIMNGTGSYLVNVMEILIIGNERKDTNGPLQEQE